MVRAGAWGNLSALGLLLDHLPRLHTASDAPGPRMVVVDLCGQELCGEDSKLCVPAGWEVELRNGRLCCTHLPRAQALLQVFSCAQLRRVDMEVDVTCGHFIPHAA